MEILTRIFGYVSDEQAQNEVKFDFQVKFDFEGQNESHQNNMNLNQGVLHRWSKFGDQRMMNYRMDKLCVDADTDGSHGWTHIHAIREGDDDDHHYHFYMITNIKNAPNDIIAEMTIIETSWWCKRLW